VNESPRVGVVSGFTELASFYAEPPAGVRANMIFSADGAAAFGGRAGPLSCPTDQQLLGILRGFADVVLVGAGTARAENYGPVRLTDAQRARRHGEGQTRPPPIAVISRTGELPARLFSNPDQPPILLTCAQSAARRDLTGDRRWRVLVAGEDSVDVAHAVALLGAHGMHRILCEGGPTLLDELVDADAVAEICVTLAPKLAASQPVGHRLQPSRLPVPVAMRLEHALVYDEYLFLKYRR
jgi:riboflavin biosynthesis pyrimidine reductase